MAEYEIRRLNRRLERLEDRLADAGMPSNSIFDGLGDQEALVEEIRRQKARLRALLSLQQ